MGQSNVLDILSHIGHSGWQLIEYLKKEAIARMKLIHWERVNAKRTAKNFEKNQLPRILIHFKNFRIISKLFSFIILELLQIFSYARLFSLLITLVKKCIPHARQILKVC